MNKLIAAMLLVLSLPAYADQAEDIQALKQEVSALRDKVNSFSEELAGMRDSELTLIKLSQSHSKVESEQHKLNMHLILAPLMR